MIFGSCRFFFRRLFGPDLPSGSHQGTLALIQCGESNIRLPQKAAASSKNVKKSWSGQFDRTFFHPIALAANLIDRAVMLRYYIQYDETKALQLGFVCPLRRFFIF